MLCLVCLSPVLQLERWRRIAAGMHQQQQPGEACQHCMLDPSQLPTVAAHSLCISA